MSTIRSFFTRPLTTDSTDATLSSLAAYAAGILICACGFIGVGELDATTTETFLAILGVLILSTIMIVLGQLIEIHHRLRLIHIDKSDSSD